MDVVWEDEVPGPLGILPVLEAVSVNRRFPPGIEMPFVTRRGDVQTLARLEVHTRSGEMEFQAVLVLVSHPKDVVAVRPQPGKSMAFEALNDPLLHPPGNALALLFLEGEDPVGVPLLEVQRVDDSGRAVGISAHDLRVHIPMLFEKVIHKATPACPTSP
jgi:hypothetical protein